MRVSDERIRNINYTALNSTKSLETQPVGAESITGNDPIKALLIWILFTVAHIIIIIVSGYIMYFEGPNLLIIIGNIFFMISQFAAWWDWRSTSQASEVNSKA